ncbi:MAG: hypothetical protein AAF560_19485 [Acidobacteriota bacterium]
MAPRTSHPPFARRLGLAASALLWALTLLASPTAATTFWITDFGALPDDGLDDGSAIQAAIDAACDELALGTLDVEVAVPPGVFELTRGDEPTADLPWVILKLPCSGLTIRGQPAVNGSAPTLRLAAAQGAFESLLGSAEFAQPVDRLTLRDLTFDGNGAENPILGGDDDFDDVLREPRYALRVYTGSGIRIENTRFTGWRNLNVITLNGVEVADVAIVGNRFDAIGQPPELAPDWDHSTIYTDCAGALIEDNKFSSLGPGTFGVRTAIETHGPNQIVRGNRIESYTTGLNVTGVSVLGSNFHRVENNQFLGVADGIRIWAFEVAGNPPGEPVLVDAVIRNNLIEIAVDAWRGTQDAFEQANVGISLVANSDGVIEDLTLEANEIIFGDFGLAPRDYDRNSAGIRLSPDLLPDLPISGLTLRRNTITNALATAIYLGSPLPEGATLAHTRIVNAGAGPKTLPDGLKTGILVFGAYRDVTIQDTCLVDTNPAGPTLAQAFYLFADSLGGSRIADTGLELASGSLEFLRLEEPIGMPWEVQPPTASCSSIFRDSFERGDTTAWSSASR